MHNEPLVKTATITAAVTAILGLLVSFGVDLTADQQSNILAVVAVAAPLAVALLARKKVTPYFEVIDPGPDDEGDDGVTHTH